MLTPIVTTPRPASEEATTSPSQPAGQLGGEREASSAAVGLALNDLFMPQYVRRPPNSDAYTHVIPVGSKQQEQPASPSQSSVVVSQKSAQGESKSGVGSGELHAADSTSAELLQRITAEQSTALRCLKSANSRLKAFGNESDRLMPSSSTALFQHVQLIAAVRKELESVGLRVSRCLERAEKIKAFDEAAALSQAAEEESEREAKQSTASTYGGSSSPSPASPTAVACSSSLATKPSSQGNDKGGCDAEDDSIPRSQDEENAPLAVTSEGEAPTTTTCSTKDEEGEGESKELLGVEEEAQQNAEGDVSEEKAPAAE